MAGDAIDDRRTVYLGQYTEDNAEVITRRLDEAGIEWWQKQSGWLARFVFMGDWGVRLFVDESRRDEAEAIATDVTRA